MTETTNSDRTRKKQRKPVQKTDRYRRGEKQTISEGNIRKIFNYSKISKTKIFIFEYFSKIPSDMNSNDPFYPILIPNTPYVKFSLFFFLVVGGGGPNNLKIFLKIFKNYFN